MARPATISVDSITEAALAIGLADLSVSAVAERLGVTRAAVYRHIGGRRELEDLVGEHILGEATFQINEGETVEEYLERFAIWLRSLCVDVPGLANYLTDRFLRTEQSARMTEQIMANLVNAGWTPAQALFISDTVGTHALALIRAEPLFGDERALLDQERLTAISSHPLLSEALPKFDGVAPDMRFQWYLRCTIFGVLAIAARDLPL